MSLRFNPLTGNLDFDTKSSGLWSTVIDTVINNSSKVADTISLTGLNSVTYKITIYNTSESVSRTFDMTVNNANGSLRDSISKKVGSNINYSIDASVNSGNMELTIINNESFSLEISMAKLVL